MSDLDKYLIPTETPVVVTHRHWAAMLRTGCYCAAVLLLGLWLLIYTGDNQVLADVAVIGMLVSLAWFGAAWYAWREEQFVITDRRVLLIDGILSRRVAIMPLTKVTDLTYERSLAGRLLGYGVFVIESAGQHQALSRIDYLPTPDKLYQDVSTLLFSPHSVLNSRPGRYGSDRNGDHPTTPLPPVG